MLEALPELLGYARKLVPLLELYTSRRPPAPVVDPGTREFQNYAAEVLRANRGDLMELRSAVESLHQRLKVLDDQAVSAERELARVSDQLRILTVGVIIAAVASLGALVMGIIAAARH